MNRRPYSLLSSLPAHMEQSLENFLSPVNASLGSLRESIFSPRADVRECGDRYAICLDMPGVAIEDIDVEVNDGILTIQGVRSSSQSQQDAGMHRVERLMGTFQRRFALPDNVDFEAVSASSRDGVLEVTVPKLPERAPRKIKVQAGSRQDIAGPSHHDQGDPDHQQVARHEATQEA